MVDTLGLLLHAIVHPADIQDRDGGVLLLSTLFGKYPFLLKLESLGFAENFLSSCELEALHFIGIRSFGEEFREDVVFRGIQEKFRKPLA